MKTHASIICYYIISTPVPTTKYPNLILSYAGKYQCKGIETDWSTPTGLFSSRPSLLFWAVIEVLCTLSLGRFLSPICGQISEPAMVRLFCFYKWQHDNPNATVCVVSFPENILLFTFLVASLMCLTCPPPLPSLAGVTCLCLHLFRI